MSENIEYGTIILFSMMIGIIMSCTIYRVYKCISLNNIDDNDNNINDNNIKINQRKINQTKINQRKNRDYEEIV